MTGHMRVEQVAKCRGILSGLGEDYLVQGQIRHDALEALVFNLKLLQPFELIAAHAALAIVLGPMADIWVRV
jgi:hypothetical protein